MKRKGFTLIELLIVVAIIGILAAIAVPNFMNAQMRAKIARAQADMKTCQTAIEQLRIDKGVMLIDFWDDDRPEGQDRMANIFRGVGGTHNDRGGTAGIFAPLTSPVAYLSSVPLDPFLGIAIQDNSNLIAADVIPPLCYMYTDEDPAIPGSDIGIGFFGPGNAANLQRVGLRPLREGMYVLIGAGPDGGRGAYNVAADGMGLPFDASNGVKSKGDIILMN